MTTRRTTLILLGLVVFVPERAAHAQQTRGVPRIGWLVPGTAAVYGAFLEEFRLGMRDLGYVEGRTYVIEYRFADGNMDRLPVLAAELAKLRVDVIVTSGAPGTFAAKQVTRTIPVVFAAIADPVGSGVVASLARPGENVTGLSVMASDLSGKRLELLHALVPRMSRLAILWDSSNAGMALRVRETQLAAEELGIVLRSVGTRSLDELEAALAELTKQRPDGLLVTAEPFTRRHMAQILDFSARNRIPTTYEDDSFVDAGGLMSYGPSVLARYRRAAMYVDKILKGADPGSIPVEQPTTFDLVVNLKTARALGLTIPQSLLRRVDRVIE
jgi:putative ABC transport system substrate-binding protein